MANRLASRWWPFLYALLFGMLVCVLMLVFGRHYAHSGHFDFLLWNLFLAAVPLALAIGLSVMLRTRRWSSWPAIGVSLVWLLFLPNSFYMISDFIHLREVASADILYNAVMFTSFIYLGVLLGFCSLYIMHHELHRRLSSRVSAAIISLTLLVCACAIYVGRDLRWNSWDAVVNPFGLLFDISDRLLRPEDYPDMFVVIAIFFALLASLYAVVWTAARALRRK